MNMYIEHPFFLLLAPVLAVYFLLTAKKYLHGKKDMLFVFFRMFLTGIFLLALSGVHIQMIADKTMTLFAADNSASMAEAKETQERFIQEAARFMKSQDEAGVIAFGEHAVVEINPGEEIAPFILQNSVSPSATSLEEAIRLGLLILPEDRKKRIVLLSDGRETVGNGEVQARLAASQNVQIDVVPLSNPLEREVQCSQLKLPAYINKGSRFSIEMSVESLTETEGEIRLYRNNELLSHQQVLLREGENHFLFSDRVEKGGSLIFKGEILASDDTRTENNSAYAYSYAADAPSVLLVEQDKSRQEMEKLLKKAGVHTTLAKPEEVPLAQEILNQYDCVLLENVPLSSLPEAFLPVLESYVRDTGGGLFVSGGTEAFALGGYYGSKLEEILPVSMELKTDSENPNLSMVMVLDRSGSMSQARYGLSIMEIAKEAAIRGINGLSGDDMAGVVAFDSEPEWAVPFQQVGENRDAILRGIGQIQPNGGTSILPALKEAYRVLEHTQTRRKHILLLTDGQAEDTGYDELLAEMKKNNITLSTVAVGDDAAATLLEGLAEKGGGRFYFTNEFTDLPEIFTKETFLAGGEYINERVFYPVPASDTPVLPAEAVLPPLTGYISVTAKPRAEVVLVSDTKEPILSFWQYGLGRTGAWQSDTNGQWSDAWLSSEEGVNVLSNAVSWVMRKQGVSRISASAERKGTDVALTLSMQYEETVKKVSATVVSSDGASYPVDLSMVSPGIYKGMFPQAEPGAYTAAVQIERQTGENELVNTGFSLPYAREYDIREDGIRFDKLERIASLTGGRILKTPEEVFTELPAKARSDKDLSCLLFILVLQLFVCDIALHRFSWLSEKVLEFFPGKDPNFAGKTDNRRRKKPAEKPKKKKQEQQVSTGTAAKLRENLKRRNR